MIDQWAVADVWRLPDFIEFSEDDALGPLPSDGVVFIRRMQSDAYAPRKKTQLVIDRLTRNRHCPEKVVDKIMRRYLSRRDPERGPCSVRIRDCTWFTPKNLLTPGPAMFEQCKVCSAPVQALTLRAGRYEFPDPDVRRRTRELPDEWDPWDWNEELWHRRQHTMCDSPVCNEIVAWEEKRYHIGTRHLAQKRPKEDGEWDYWIRVVACFTDCVARATRSARKRLQ